MRPPSYYNTLANSTSYSSSNYYNNPSTSQQLRSSIGSSSSSSYVTRTHLPFVSQSVLVAHCITGAGTSTRPYGQSPSSRFIQSRPVSAKRLPSSYLSSTSYTPRTSTSYLSSSGRISSTSSASSYRPSSSTSYYKPTRLRERPLLSQISHQLRNTSIREESDKERKLKRESEADERAEETWSTDVARNISRNKYIIKFREIDKRPDRTSDATSEPVIAEPSLTEELREIYEKTAAEQVQEALDSIEAGDMRLIESCAQDGANLFPIAKHQQDCDDEPIDLYRQQVIWESSIPETVRVRTKDKRNIKLKINNIRDTKTTEVSGDSSATKAIAEVKVKRNVKKKLTAAKSEEDDTTGKEVPVEPTFEQVKVDESVKKAELERRTGKEVEPQSPSEKKVNNRIRFRQYNIDDFDFLTVLGHGGWGFVILAELKKHDTFFAVKCIKKITIVEDDDFDSIMIERKVLTLGNLHPFICKLFCTFETEGYLFFAMEYCAGGDLMFHVQREGKFDEPRCRFYAAEIISAIRFLHNRHIIYRDLKLDNILLDAQGHVRLVDFGMCQCRTYREELLPSNFCGTPEYISPEIIKGVPYNHSVDWWSFGVLLYEMAVGKMPFRGGDENELLWNVCYEQIHYPMFLSKELTSLLQLLLEREPTKRMGMATCKAGDIYEQPWFSGLDWASIEQLRVQPPFVPEVTSKRDVQNFDADFTRSTPELSPVDAKTLQRIDQNQFQQFPYTNPNIFIFE